MIIYVMPWVLRRLWQSRGYIMTISRVISGMRILRQNRRPYFMRGRTESRWNFLWWRMMRITFICCRIETSVMTGKTMRWRRPISCVLPEMAARRRKYIVSRGRWIHTEPTAGTGTAACMTDGCISTTGNPSVWIRKSMPCRQWTVENPVKMPWRSQTRFGLLRMLISGMMPIRSVDFWQRTLKDAWKCMPIRSRQIKSGRVISAGAVCRMKM